MDEGGFLSQLTKQQLVNRLALLTGISNQEHIVKIFGSTYNMDLCKSSKLKKLMAAIRKVQKVEQYEEARLNKSVNQRILSFLEFKLICAGCLPYSQPHRRKEICMLCNKQLFPTGITLKSKIYDQVIQLECSHFYHSECIYIHTKNRSHICLQCNRHYVTPKFGDQPDGCMHLQMIYQPLTYTHVKQTVQITYCLKTPMDGLLKYVAFIPYSEQGIIIIMRLQVLFNRRLLFDIVQGNIMVPKVDHIEQLQGLKKYHQYEQEFYSVVRAQIESIQEANK